MESENSPSSISGKEIVIIAGESSGDLHGSNLVREMKSLDTGLSFSGIGGEKMKDAGVSLLAHASDIAVVGFTEVFPKLKLILAARRSVKEQLKKRRPDLLILIDFPDFNMPLAKFAHGLGIPVFYYISPQVWAWRKNRIYFLEKYVNRMAVILPFEEEVYRSTSLDVRFVGHPLADRVSMGCSRDEALEKLGLRGKGKILALVPGSREREVSCLLPVMLEAARIISSRIQGVQFVLPLAEGISSTIVENALRKTPVDITVVKNSFYEALGVSDGAIVASGTSTLEAALLGVPMVIVYKVSFFSYFLGRIFINVDHIGLVNIISGREVVPEYIQSEADPDKISRGLLDMITDESRRKRVVSDLLELRKKLGDPGAAAKTAAMALELLEKGSLEGYGSGSRIVSSENRSA
ncbi:MAG: lipid-A-disaccharide synthase [Syntrophales bacterium]|nr:lipid-A-disaccharide synthase [Syntrophales bacterium]